MKCNLSGAFGLALLAASFVFGGSVAYAQVSETEALAVVAAAPETNADVEKDALTCGIDRSDAVAACKTDAELDALPESAAPDVDQAPAAIGEVEPLATEPPAQGVTSYDAIVVDIVETVTVAVPGNKSADEEPGLTGSLPVEESIAPPASGIEGTTVGSADDAIYDDIE